MRRVTPVGLLAVAVMALLGSLGTTVAARVAAASGSSSPSAQRVTIRLMPARAGHEVVPAPNFAIRPGIPVTVTFLNTSREYHTFTVPKLGVSALILPGSPHKPRATRVTFTAFVSGVFAWHCVFCPRVHHKGLMGGKVYAIIGA